MNSVRKTSRATRSGALALLAAAGITAGASAEYSVIDLGTLGGPTAAGFAVNDFGRVAGMSTRMDANVRGFLWDDGLTEVAPLAGDQQSAALGVTDGDLVVGMSYDLGELNVHGFAWQAGSATPLGNFAPRGVSDNGLIVGYVTVSDSSYGWVDHAARYVGGTLFDMGTLGGSFSYAYDATSDGRIVGASAVASDAAQFAFLWQAGAFHNLGTLGGLNSQAYAINEAGDVVGWAQTAGGVSHAFLFTTDAAGNVVTRTNLGELGGGYSYAYGVNAQQQVVGTSDGRAFLWENGAMQDLNSLISPAAGWTLEAAWDINDAGWIVGVGQHRGFPHAFLLAPNDCPDLDGDGDVDLADLSALLTNYGMPGGASFEDGDLDADGDVDIADLSALLTAFGTMCP
ncbi:MAG: hypothetical protein HRF50_11285 [Phycisphaerae bacterium]|jgi:probable HAF family extracellular repeat protein